MITAIKNIPRFIKKKAQRQSDDIKEKKVINSH